MKCTRKSCILNKMRMFLAKEVCQSPRYCLGILLFLSLCFTVNQLGYAREGDGRKPMLAPGYKDYFLKDVDRKTYELIRNVTQNHLDPAVVHLSKGKPNRAIPELTFVLRYVPNHPKALQLMGLAARLIKKPPIAERYYKQAIRVFPKHGITHAQYGKFLVDIGQVEEGIQELEAAKSIPPDLTIVYVWLTEAYEKSGNPEKAQIARKKATDLKKKEVKPIKP